MVTMTSHMTVRSHRMGTTVTSSLHLMSISVCVTVLLLLHGGHRDLMCHRYDWVVDLVRGVCPHARSRHHHSSRNRAGGSMVTMAVLVHHDVAGRVGVGAMISMSVSPRGVVRSLVACRGVVRGSLQVRTVAPSGGGHSHGDLGHLLKCLDKQYSL